MTEADVRVLVTFSDVQRFNQVHVWRSKALVLFLEGGPYGRAEGVSRNYSNFGGDRVLGIDSCRMQRGTYREGQRKRCLWAWPRPRARPRPGVSLKVGDAGGIIHHVGEHQSLFVIILAKNLVIT